MDTCSARARNRIPSQALRTSWSVSRRWQQPYADACGAPTDNSRHAVSRWKRHETVAPVRLVAVERAAEMRARLWLAGFWKAARKIAAAWMMTDGDDAAFPPSGAGARVLRRATSDPRRPAGGCADLSACSLPGRLACCRAASALLRGDGAARVLAESWALRPHCTACRSVFFAGFDRAGGTPTTDRRRRAPPDTDEGADRRLGRKACAVRSTLTVRMGAGAGDRSVPAARACNKGGPTGGVEEGRKAWI